MKATIKLGWHEYEGDLEVGRGWSAPDDYFWMFDQADDPEKVPVAAKYPFTYEYLGGKYGNDYERQCCGYRSGFKSEAEALADAISHGITLESETV